MSQYEQSVEFDTEGVSECTVIEVYLFPKSHPDLLFN